MTSCIWAAHTIEAPALQGDVYWQPDWMDNLASNEHWPTHYGQSYRMTVSSHILGSVYFEQGFEATIQALGWCGGDGDYWEAFRDSPTVYSVNNAPSWTTSKHRIWSGSSLEATFSSFDGSYVMRGLLNYPRGYEQ